tara:strand:- start:2970 stop:3686 length:717 start_codon:yes stop_codon:yes gene_type:complete
MAHLNLKEFITEKTQFFFRVFKIARTWGFINILKFIPYEIFYGFKFKVNTLFSVNHQELDVSQKMKENSTEYFPTPYYIARKVFRIIKSDLVDCEFVDFGCGAGRILMALSDFRPKKIVGVEFSEILSKQAEDNLNVYFRENKKRFPDWEIVCEDALEYFILPLTNVFFFYDPFNEKTMRKMVNKINVSILEYPRPIKVIYISPRHRDIFIEYGYQVVESSVNKYEKGYMIFSNGSGL